MLQKIEELAPRPGSADEFVAEQPPDADPEPGIGEIHHQQRQQKRRSRHAHEADKGEQIIEKRVLPHRRINADGDGNHPGAQNGDQGNQNGQAQALPDQGAHGLVQLERLAEISPDNPADPLPILHRVRLIQAVTLPQTGHLGFVDLLAGLLHLRHPTGQKIPRGQLNQNKGNDADQQQSRDHDQHPPYDVGQHDALPDSICLMGPRRDKTARD